MSVKRTFLTDGRAVARAAAEPGETVLLAPAAASFDQYDNFERRGEDFIAAVEAAVGSVARGPVEFHREFITAVQA